MSKKLSAVACLALTLLAACLPPIPSIPNSTSPPPTLSSDVQFNIVSSGDAPSTGLGTAKTQLVVIQSSTEFAAAVVDNPWLEAARSTDFSSRTLIGVFIKGLSAGCEHVTISSITDDGNHLTVNASTTNSSGTTPCLPVMIDGGYILANLEKTTKPITLVTHGDVHFNVVAKGTFNGSPQNSFFVIQSTAELDAALAKVTIRRYPPIIADFTTQTLLGVFVAHSSPCDETVITSVKADAAGITVNANHISRPNVICIASVVGGSFELVTIDKTSRPVAFALSKIEPPAGYNFPFNVISNGDYQGAAQNQLLVIQSSAELSSALANLTLSGNAPTADFTRQTLIGVFVNTATSSGCEKVAVSTIIEENNSPTITVNALVSTARSPLGPNTCTIVAHNGTYAFVTMTKTTTPITLTIRHDVHFVTVTQGSYIGTPQKQQLVIQSEAEFTAALTGVSTVSGGQITINVDFAKQTLLGLFVTHATTGCDGGTGVAKITDDGAKLTVTAEHVTHVNLFCAAVFYDGTYVFVAVPKTTKPATFVVTEVVVTH